MTPAELASYVRFKTRTNSTTFSDFDILALLEIRQDEISRAIMRADEDILLIPQTQNLVANQREYGLPSDILSRIKRVEAKLDGTNWLKLNELDLTEHDKPTTVEANITYYFANLEGQCFYDIKRTSLYLYTGTITSVTSGLKVWCNTWPTPVTDLTSTYDMSVDPSTTTHGIPRAMHEIWARGVIIDYKESREKPIPLSERELNYMDDLYQAIEDLKHGNLDREVIGFLPDAQYRGNDGQDY